MDITKPSEPKLIKRSAWPDGGSAGQNNMKSFPRFAALVAVATLFCLSSVCAQSVSSSSARLALVGGTVISATGAAPIPDATVLVENGRITAVGPRASVTIPRGTDVLDTRSKFITPGLIDTNVHLVLMTVPEFFVKYEDRFEDIALESAQIGLKYGFTTLMDTWGPLAWKELAAASRFRKRGNKNRRANHCANSDCKECKEEV